MRLISLLLNVSIVSVIFCMLSIMFLDTSALTQPPKITCCCCCHSMIILAITLRCSSVAALLK